MLSWTEFAVQEAETAEAGAALFDEHRLGYLATVRRDGSPRLHPVSPIRTDQGLYIAVSDSSPKRWDLARDGRYALHAPLGSRDDEFVVTGRARLVRDAATRKTIETAADHVVHSTDWIFELWIETCLQGHWEHVGQPDTYPVRRFWRAESNNGHEAS